MTPTRGGAGGASVVIGGGGVAGIAWALGVVVAFMERGLDLGRIGQIVGTSAGATVGAQIATGQVEQALAAQYEPSREIAADVDIVQYQRQIGALIEGAVDGHAARTRIGQWAIDTATVSEAERRAVIEHRLRGADWSDELGAQLDLIITAVDASSGELQVFTRDGGVSLVDAVAASCAVPGVWPPVTIAGRRYIDGGMRSVANADLALGSEPRLVIIPSRLDDRGRARLHRELDSPPADTAGWQPPPTVVIEPDERSLVALGSNPFDPAVRPAAADAGRAQAAASAARWAERLGG